VSPQAEAVVDLDAFRGNVETLAALAPSAQFMAVVKADGYGHGMVPIARAAREAGAAWLGVATIDEALVLRAAGDTGRVLCWLAAPGSDYAGAVAADVDLTASSAEQLAEILAVAPTRPRVQLKVDTGMGRNGALGAQWTELVAAAVAAQRAGKAEIVAAWSHFACADEPDHRANDAQERGFTAAVEELEAAGITPELRHLANSAALLSRPSAHLDIVRAGIATYGISPMAHTPIAVPLRQVLTLRARLVTVKRAPAGTGVSYGHRYTTDRETTLGLVPIGYGDGVLRAATGRARAGFAGQQVPVAGTICMDQLVVDLGDAPAKPGDVVTLFGPGDHGEPTVEDWAQAAGTIGYEVLTQLGGRLRHTYRGER
jgi:alanine racemase